MKLPSTFANKCARNVHQRMNCESGAVSSVCNYASGEGSKHILIFHDFHDIRINYVVNVQSVTRIFCNQKSIVFIVSDSNNRIATAVFFADVYKTPVELRKICVRTRKWRMCVLTHEYKVESVTCDQHDGV